jgi:vacuole morphology and inheritance protein 14
LFKAWCHNAVATFSLCLLAQAYEQAYHLLQVLYVSTPHHLSTTNSHSADLEMTVNTLIQIDKLVQLLESPVFTCMYQIYVTEKTQLIHPRSPHPAP